MPRTIIALEMENKKTINNEHMSKVSLPPYQLINIFIYTHSAYNIFI